MKQPDYSHLDRMDHSEENLLQQYISTHARLLQTNRQARMAVSTWGDKERIDNIPLRDPVIMIQR